MITNRIRHVEGCYRYYAQSIERCYLLQKSKGKDRKLSLFVTNLMHQYQKECSRRNQISEEAREVLQIRTVVVTFVTIAVWSVTGST